MPFIGNAIICEPFLRGTLEHHNKALFQKRPQTCLKVMMVPYWTTWLSIWYTSPHQMEMRMLWRGGLCHPCQRQWFCHWWWMENVGRTRQRAAEVKYSNQIERRESVGMEGGLCHCHWQRHCSHLWWMEKRAEHCSVLQNKTQQLNGEEGKV